MFKKLPLIIALIFAGMITLSLTVCENHDPDDSEISLSISLINGEAGSERSVDNRAIYYEILLTGSGTPVRMTAYGGQTVSATVSAGRWNVDISGYYPDRNTLYSTGSNSVDVKAGQNNVVEIKMNIVSSGGSGGGGTGSVPNSAKAIISFSFPTTSPVSTGTINEAAKTIDVTVPVGTDITNLTPTVTHTGASYSPPGAQDFTNPVTYTVTAADSSTETYTVTVLVYHYTITGSGASFTATRVNETIISGANHQDTLNAIRDHANGNDCAIQLGPGGGTYLDVGGSYLQFTGGPWGEVTLSGAITCTFNNNAYIGTITIANGTAIIIKSTANIRNTSGSLNYKAFVNMSSTATFIMDGGTISSGNAGSTGALRNVGGTIIINGGTVSSSSHNRSTALENDSGGTVTIYGGTIQASLSVDTAEGFYTVKNNSGTVTIYSPPAVISPLETSGAITWMP